MANGMSFRQWVKETTPEESNVLIEWDYPIDESMVTRTLHRMWNSAKGAVGNAFSDDEEAFEKALHAGYGGVPLGATIGGLAGGPGGAIMGGALGGALGVGGGLLTKVLGGGVKGAIDGWNKPLDQDNPPPRTMPRRSPVRAAPQNPVRQQPDAVRQPKAAHDFVGRKGTLRSGGVARRISVIKVDRKNNTATIRFDDDGSTRQIDLSKLLNKQAG